MNANEEKSTDVAPTKINIENIEIENIEVIQDINGKKSGSIEYFVLTFTDSDQAGMYYRNSDSKDRHYNLKRFILKGNTFKVQVEEFFTQLEGLTAYKTSKIFESKDPTQTKNHDQLMDNIRKDGITF